MSDAKPLGRKHDSRPKEALVTGGAKGIGRQIARTFAGQGARVAIADIDRSRMHQTEREIRAIAEDALSIEVDIRQEHQVRALMARVADHFGRIDILVNNAGIVPHFAWGVPRWPVICDMEEVFWDKVLSTNLGGTFLCTKHVLPYMASLERADISSICMQVVVRICVSTSSPRTQLPRSRASWQRRNARTMSALSASRRDRPSLRRTRPKKQDVECRGR